MEGVVQRARCVGDDPLEVVVGGLNEVHGGDVVNGVAILVDEEVECDTVFAKILDMDQW